MKENVAVKKVVKKIGKGWVAILYNIYGTQIDWIPLRYYRGR